MPIYEYLCRNCRASRGTGPPFDSPSVGAAFGGRDLPRACGALCCAALFDGGDLWP
jgi:hypothetical protein